MVPTSAVGSPVGSPACSPMVPASAVGSPITNAGSTDAAAGPAAAGALGGISSLILPNPVWPGAAATASGSAMAAAGATAGDAGGSGARYGSPLLVTATHLAGNASGSSPAAAGAGPAAAAPAMCTRGRSRSPAGASSRPKLVRQQSRMAPKPLKASVSSITGGYHSSSTGMASAALPQPTSADLYAAGGLAGCGPAIIPSAVGSDAHAAAGAAAAADYGGNGYTGGATVAVTMPLPAGTDAFAAANAAAADEPAAAISGTALGARGAGAAAPAPVWHPDSSTTVLSISRDGNTSIAATDAAVMTVGGPSALKGSKARKPAALNTAVMSDVGLPAGSKVPDQQQQPQQLTTAAAAAAAFGAVGALTVDPDLEDAGWLWGEGGLLPDTPGPANLLAQQQQQQELGKVPIGGQQQQHADLQVALPSVTSRAAVAPAAAAVAASSKPPAAAMGAGVHTAGLAANAAAAVAVSTATSAAAAHLQLPGSTHGVPTVAPAAAPKMGPAAAPAAAVSSFGLGGEATQPLGTDKDDIALLQVLLGWANDP